MSLLSPTSRPLFEAVAECTRNGARVGALPYDFRSKSRHASRMTQKSSEAFLAAHALVAVDLREFDLVDSERPDFVLNGEIGLEVAELVEPESARIANAVENIKIGVRDRIDGDPHLQAALGDRFISINTWDTPKRSMEVRIVEECCRLIVQGNPALMNGNMMVDPAFPAMRAHRAHIYSGALTGGYFDYTTPPCAFDPMALAQIAMQVLERKRKKAASYSGNRLWLVMSVTDMMGDFDASVVALGGIDPPIGPFEKVVIRGSRNVTVWTGQSRFTVAV